MTITISIPNIVINISNTQNLNLEQMAHTIEELRAEIAETKTLAAGVKTLIAGLQKKVQDALDSVNTGGDVSAEEVAALKAEIDAAFSDLSGSNDELAAALTENTPTPAPTDGGVTPPVVDTPAPVDTTPAPVDGGGTSTDPVPVDGPVAPGTPDVPTAPAVPGTPITNADGSTVI